MGVHGCRQAGTLFFVTRTTVPHLQQLCKPFLMGNVASPLMFHPVALGSVMATLLKVSDPREKYLCLKNWTLGVHIMKHHSCYRTMPFIHNYSQVAKHK